VLYMRQKGALMVSNGVGGEKKEKIFARKF
jgi:hypothetical protein